jgi:NADH-quinone oxidoreductase subunit C
MEMENDTIIGKLQVRFGSDILSVDTTSDMPSVLVSKAAIHEVVGFLKAEGYQFLTDLCGVHYPDQALELGVVYHLHDFAKNRRIRIKTFVAKDQPVLPTVTDIFSGANWMERETYDFYGILFEGHPNLIRILNVEYLDYFPMRKEYPLEDPTREDKDDRYFGR